jgi:Glyoxalase/Bleomycin resistance protein/Dioxygenase superfamily
MTEASIKNPSKPVLGVAEPQLFVGDIRASCDFYREKLGFHARFVYGEPPFYAQVVRDAARLNLRHLDSPIVLDDPEALFQEYQANTSRLGNANDAIGRHCKEPLRRSNPEATYCGPWIASLRSQ